MKTTPIRDRGPGSLSSGEKPRKIYADPLSKKEIIKWNHMKEKIGPEAEKYRDLTNPENIQKIRLLICPPVWKPWGQNKFENRGNTEGNVENSQHEGALPLIK